MQIFLVGDLDPVRGSSSAASQGAHMQEAGMGRGAGTGSRL